MGVDGTGNWEVWGGSVYAFSQHNEEVLYTYMHHESPVHVHAPRKTLYACWMERLSRPLHMVGWRVRVAEVLYAYFPASCTCTSDILF